MSLFITMIFLCFCCWFGLCVAYFKYLLPFRGFNRGSRIFPQLLLSASVTQTDPFKADLGFGRGNFEFEKCNVDTNICAQGAK